MPKDMHATVRLTILFLLVRVISYGQTQEQKDSLVFEMCKTINNSAGQKDTIRLIATYKKHLYPFLAQYGKEQEKDIRESIYFRLQRNCKEFKNILERISPPKGDWQVVEEMPATKLPSELCQSFFKHKKYKYLEASGDTVHLEIDKGYWVDRFKDGTFSKLKLYWVNDCEFEIEFVESNNSVRKKFSRQGDRYKYQINDKKEKYYDMSVEISGAKKYMIFKMHYKAPGTINKALRGRNGPA